MIGKISSDQLLYTHSELTIVDNRGILLTFVDICGILLSNKTRHGTPSGTAPGRVVLFGGHRHV